MTNSESRAPMTGIVLAGGQSTRFGADKASALLAGRPMLEWVLSALAAVCEDLVVVTRPDQDLPSLVQPLPFRVVEDVIPGQGPLAGLVYGLAVAAHGSCFAASCDMPLLQPQLVTLLASLAGGYDVVCPRVGGFLQPLGAVYRRDRCIEAFERRVAEGRRKMSDAFHRLDVCVVEEQELRSADPGLDSFVNVNRPEALAAIERRLADAPEPGASVR